MPCHPRLSQFAAAWQSRLPQSHTTLYMSAICHESLCDHVAAGLAEEHLAEPEVPNHLRQRMTVIEGQVGAVLAQCFALLKAMSEVESMVRVLQLVTVVVEVAGNSAQPYLGAFAAALPEVRRV